MVPSEGAVRGFCDLVGDFWKQPAHRRLYVAVHCLSGFNTTGFFIVSYLAQHAPLIQALKAFAIA
eukprot:scaffold154361_cov29-Tisochrysis_lutea.AAC.2